jgi:hypothetical protein
MSGKKFLLLVMLILVGTLAAVGSASAQTAEGLGSNWPNAQDISPNPQYHVYRWVQQNVTYIQVNDLNGNVKFAVGVVPGMAFVLPVGTPSSVLIAHPAPQNRVASQPAAMGMMATPVTGATVYRDSSISVLQTGQTFTVTPMVGCSDPADCAG